MLVHREIKGSRFIIISMAHRVLLSFVEAVKSKGKRHDSTVGIHRLIDGAVLNLAYRFNFYGLLETSFSSIKWTRSTYRC